MKTCSRNSCDKVFIHGYQIGLSYKYICDTCFNEFIKSYESKEYEDQLRTKQCFEKDLAMFLDTKDNFIPPSLKDQDKIINAYQIFFQNRVEILDESDEEDSIDILLNNLDKRYTKYQDNLNFIASFRKLLGECDDNTLIDLIKLAQFQALKHKTNKSICEECEDIDSEVELTHHTRGLGNIWLKAVDQIDSSE